MICALDHVTVAAPDLTAAIERFELDFGLEFGGKEDVEAALTSTAFFPINGTRIEVIHPKSCHGVLMESNHPGNEG